MRSLSDGDSRLVHNRQVSSNARNRCPGDNTALGAGNYSIQNGVLFLYTVRHIMQTGD